MVVEAPDEPLTVHGDERRIKQVFLNLISNAINYSPSGGRVTVTLRRDDRQAVVDVRDTGIGIARGDLSRIFTPFERAKNRKINTRGGAGLGLSLVRSIVRLHGGDVTIESEEGVGTHVTFRLPLKK